jgi:hypothetical protein
MVTLFGFMVGFLGYRKIDENIFQVETGDLEEIVVDKELPDLKMYKLNFDNPHHPVV